MIFLLPKPLPKKSTRSFLEWPTLVIDSFSRVPEVFCSREHELYLLVLIISSISEGAHCKTSFFPAFSHSPQTSVTLFAFVGQDVDVIQFEIVAGVLHKFCFVSLNIIP